MQLGALEIDMQLESILGGESLEQVWNVCVILTCYIDNTNTRDNKMESISWKCLVNTLRERHQWDALSILGNYVDTNASNLFPMGP